MTVELGIGISLAQVGTTLRPQSFSTRGRQTTNGLLHTSRKISRNRKYYLLESPEKWKNHGSVYTLCVLHIKPHNPKSETTSLPSILLKIWVGPTPCCTQILKETHYGPRHPLLQTNHKILKESLKETQSWKCRWPFSAIHCELPIILRYQISFAKYPKYHFPNIKIFLTTCLRESRESLDQHLLNSFSILSLLQMCYKSAEIPDAI